MAGRPTKLTDEVLSEIRKMLLDGKSEREVYETLDIPRSTWFTWRFENYDDFRTNVIDWRKEYKLSLADMVSEEILTTPAVNKEGKVDTSLMTIKQREAQFLRETLNKELYSKRSEMTGKDGEQINSTIVINYVKPTDNTNQE